MDVERYNSDVEQVRRELKLVIRDMQPRTRLVKYRIIKLFRDECGITESVYGATSETRLNEIIEKYQL